jgi:hypothetical protein
MRGAMMIGWSFWWTMFRRAMAIGRHRESFLSITCTMREQQFKENSWRKFCDSYHDPAFLNIFVCTPVYLCKYTSK